MAIKENMQEILNSSLLFLLPLHHPPTASGLVTLPLKVHTFLKCVSHLHLSSSKPSVTQIWNELVPCQSKGEKKWHLFQKGGYQHFNLSEIENRTKEMSGRTDRGQGQAQVTLFLSRSMLCALGFGHSGPIWFPFTLYPASQARSCLDIISGKKKNQKKTEENKSMALSLPAFVSVVTWGKDRLLQGFLYRSNMYSAS